MEDKKTIYDSDCLDCFLIVKRTDILEKLFSKIIIPQNVHDEISHPKTPSNIVTEFNNLKNKKFVVVEEICLHTMPYNHYKAMIDGYWGDGSIGKGEASAIALAIDKEGIVASNNLKDVKKIVEDNDIPLITAPIILTKALLETILSWDECCNIWYIWINTNHHLPNKTFADYFDNTYPNDIKIFYSL